MINIYSILKWLVLAFFIFVLSCEDEKEQSGSIAIRLIMASANDENIQVSVAEDDNDLLGDSLKNIYSLSNSKTIKEIDNTQSNKSTDEIIKKVVPKVSSDEIVKVTISISELDPIDVIVSA